MSHFPQKCLINHSKLRITHANSYCDHRNFDNVNGQVLVMEKDDPWLQKLLGNISVPLIVVSELSF